MPEPNTDRAVAGEALEGLPGSKSVARAAEAARNQGDPEGSRRTNYEGQAGTAFAKVGKTLTAQQREKLTRMRTSNPSDPKGPFLYSSPIKMPEIGNTDFLFGAAVE
jgi:hypothetical protein